MLKSPPRRGEANAERDPEKKAGQKIDFMTAYTYASGHATLRDLTDSLKELTYAFNNVIRFLMHETERNKLAVSKPIAWAASAMIFNSACSNCLNM